MKEAIPCRLDFIVVWSFNYAFCCFFNIFFIVFFASFKIKPEIEINTIPIGSLIHNGVGFLGIGHRPPAKFPHRTINIPLIRNKKNPIKAAQVLMNKSQRPEQIGRLRKAMNFELAISQKSFLLIVSFDSVVIYYFAHNDTHQPPGQQPLPKRTKAIPGRLDEFVVRGHLTTN